MEFFAEPPGSQILAVGAIIIGALVLAWLARIFVHGIVKALLDREATEGTAQELSAVELRKRMDTLDSLGAHVLQAFIAVIATLMVLGQLGLDIGPAVAGLGVVGIAVGFGAQAFVRDYLNGALILIENQFAKGDVVQIAGVAGTVEDFSLRRTTLRDLDGVVHTVPNGEIKVASNLTRVWARINQDVTVAYGTDIDKAIGSSTTWVARWPAIRSGSAASSRRHASSASNRWSRTGSRSRSSARSAPPTNGPRRATCASACSPPSRNTASRSRAHNVSS